MKYQFLLTSFCSKNACGIRLSWWLVSRCRRKSRIGNPSLLLWVKIQMFPFQNWSGTGWKTHLWFTSAKLGRKEVPPRYNQDCVSILVSVRGAMLGTGVADWSGNFAIHKNWLFVGNRCLRMIPEQLKQISYRTLSIYTGIDPLQTWRTDEPKAIWRVCLRSLPQPRL